MRGLTREEIKELIEEQFPKAQVEVSKLKITIKLSRGKRKLREFIDRLVIPHYLTMEVI